MNKYRALFSFSAFLLCIYYGVENKKMQYLVALNKKILDLTGLHSRLTKKKILLIFIFCVLNLNLIRKLSVYMMRFFIKLVSRLDKLTGVWLMYRLLVAFKIRNKSLFG